MRIALAQILSGTDPAANLDVVADYTRQAADRGAQLVVFPEAAMCRFGVPLAPIAQPLDGPWAEGVRAIAAELGIVAVAGMFVPSADAKVTNTLIATGPGVDTHYHKIHLYDAFGFAESRTVAPGYEPVVIDVGGVGVGLTTCYDIRFPELYTELARRGAQVFTVHASWGSGPGKLEQWKPEGEGGMPAMPGAIRPLFLSSWGPDCVRCRWRLHWWAARNSPSRARR